MSRKGMGIIVLLLALVVCAAAQDDLKRARAERRAGNTAAAIESYQKAVAARPDDVAALGELADTLEANSRWRDAVPYLEQLVQLQPDNAARVFQLGRYLSWTDGGADKAQAHLKRAVELAPDKAEYRFEYADVLGRKAETRDESRRELRTLLERDPNYLPAVIRLAEMLSWTGSSREEARALYERGLALEPNNLALLDGYAEMLSWTATTRKDAEKYFDKALEAHPGDPRALVGKAQLLSWTGRADQALGLYDQVLAVNPFHPVALRGKAEILNWRGRHQQARELLLQARNAAPKDPQVTLELARAEMGLGHFEQARALMNAYPGDIVGSVRDTSQEVSRALGTWMEIGYVPRVNGESQLDYHRLLLQVSTPLSSAHRMTFAYRPTYFATRDGEFNSNYFMATLDSRPGENLTTHAEVGFEQFPGFTTQVDAGLNLRYRFTQGWTLRSGFSREAVEENVVTTRGARFLGQTLGQVRANLGTLGFSYSNSVHKYDLSFSYTDGVYTGPVVASNRRWGFDANIGKSVSAYKPYVRISYGVMYWSFDHDASFYPGAAPARLVGGYFSPRKFLLNYGGVNASHKFGNKLEWDASGTLGAQNVETAGVLFGDARLASTAATNLLWRITPTNELRFGYEYLDVFNAYQRHLFRASWRHYF